MSRVTWGGRGVFLDSVTSVVRLCNELICICPRRHSRQAEFGIPVTPYFWLFLNLNQANKKSSFFVPVTIFATHLHLDRNATTCTDDVMKRTKRKPLLEFKQVFGMTG